MVSFRRIRQPLLIFLFFVVLYLIFTALAVADARKTDDSSAVTRTLSQKTAYAPSPVVPDPMIGSVVYVTGTGTKYHRFRDCSALRKSSSVEGLLWEAAIERGYEECDVCAKRATE